MRSPKFAVQTYFGCLLFLLAASTENLAAQTPQNPGYTIQANTRLVLTDVTVTDSHGSPVHGLKSSDFEILDNHKEETISTFEEHATQPTAAFQTVSAAPGSYSNDFLQHLPPVLNIVVIDIKNIEIEDQMYLSEKLTQLINTLPAGQPLAIYWCRGANTVLLQNYTADHALLLAAVHKALPRFPPTGREFLNDLNTLQQIAFDLRQTPGRKNILWYTGGSTLTLRPDADGFQMQDSSDEEKARAIYDELETERIAIYPIDARGLTVTGSGFGNTVQLAQHAQMQNVAYATGGKAFYNSNGLDSIASSLLDNDGSFYTLTYSPHDFQQDNKWHKVEIRLASGLAGGSKGHDSGYTLSYRRGYFADAFADRDNGSAGSNKVASDSPRRLLGGGTVSEEDPDARSSPIIFQVVVLPSAGLPPDKAKADVSVPFDPAKQKSGTTTYSIRYALPLDAFAIRSVSGRSQVKLGIAAMAFNQSGSTANHAADEVEIFLKDNRTSVPANTLVTVRQQINLPRGDDSLYCAVWDRTNHRIGTIRVPLKVTK
jgi:VWFA-related protein